MRMASGDKCNRPGPHKYAREEHVYSLALPESAVQACAMCVLLALAGRLLWADPGSLVAFAALAATAAVTMKVVAFLHCVSSWQCALRLAHIRRTITYNSAKPCTPLNFSHSTPFRVPSPMCCF